MISTLCTWAIIGCFHTGGEPVTGASQEGPVPEREHYLSWMENQATEIARALRANGRVGGWLDARVVHTEHSYNYKLRATWLTPEVIRATARLKQLEQGLTDEETIALVEEAESSGDTVVLVEIDPRESSGIIPLEWTAILWPKTADDKAPGLKGVRRPELRNVKALSGTGRRDYAYDVFWVIFSLVGEKGEPLFPEEVRDAELVVRIHNKEGRLSWPTPRSIRERAASLHGAS